jgi:hypothetical protein
LTTTPSESEIVTGKIVGERSRGDQKRVLVKTECDEYFDFLIEKEDLEKMISRGILIEFSGDPYMGEIFIKTDCTEGEEK